MSGVDDLYREQILEHHRTPHNFGVLEQPSVSIDGRNPSCGDLITMQLKLDDAGVITDVAFSGRGCAISQASASLLTDELRGKHADEITELGTPYVTELLGIEVGPARIHCALLGLETTQKAIATWRNKS
jgi:nitrogen fixation NifU-like protein